MPVRPAFSSQRLEGLVLVCFSAALFSTAGIFTKGVAADAWSVLFWRGLAAALCLVAWSLLRDGGFRRRLGGPAFLATMLMAGGTIAFIPAFKLTSVANVSLIYAACPLLAALLGWLLLRERPSARVMAASLAALGGVLLIVGGSLGGSLGGAGPRGGLAGDLLALWMTAMMAATLVVYRRWPATSAVLPTILSSLLLLPPALIAGRPLEVAAADLPPLLAFGIVFALAAVALSAGARRLPASEAALLSALETPLAPLWAALLLAETPAATTLAGGAVVFVAVLAAQVPSRAPRFPDSHRHDFP